MTKTTIDIPGLKKIRAYALRDKGMTLKKYVNKLIEKDLGKKMYRKLLEEDE